MSLTLSELNAASDQDFVALLAGTYEHSPWVAERAAAARPFRSLAHLKATLSRTVREAGIEEQLRLIRAHPELAGKAMVARTLTAESTNEQGRAGLTDCTPAEFEHLQQLNRDYNVRFGFPFILAVRGPRGVGLSRSEIIATFERRLAHHPDFERAECLRQIHRIAELRLNDKFATAPHLGEQVWDWAGALQALGSDADYSGSKKVDSASQGLNAASQGLTVTYLSGAHQACAAQLKTWMLDNGFDEANIDAVGNVVGRYQGSDPSAKVLLTGSHYDTVRQGGAYDGRLGIFVPMACVRELARAGRRLPFTLEVVGFAEEEGQRFKATFLGSGALTGHFDPAWLDERDADGLSMREAMRSAGLPATMEAIQNLRRDPADYRGFVEVHIEQGPVLDAQDLPLGIVTSINGSVRYVGEIQGQASHAGTTPMGQRRDAAAAVAELTLFVERQAGSMQDVVGTVGILEVPSGSINVVPGRCRFSLDLRATTDAARDALDAAVRSELEALCARRGLQYTLTRTVIASAAPCDPAWRQRWEEAVDALGLPLHRMPSGAGHDAMKLHEVMPQAMLFVRGGNAGISHNPLEIITADDAQLCVEAFAHLLDKLS